MPVLRRDAYGFGVQERQRLFQGGIVRTRWCGDRRKENAQYQRLRNSCGLCGRQMKPSISSADGFPKGEYWHPRQPDATPFEGAHGLHPPPGQNARTHSAVDTSASTDPPLATADAGGIVPISFRPRRYLQPMQLSYQSRHIKARPRKSACCFETLLTVSKQYMGHIINSASEWQFLPEDAPRRYSAAEGVSLYPLRSAPTSHFPSSAAQPPRRDGWRKCPASVPYR